MNEDIRWRQRFDNFQRALQTMTEAVDLAAQRDLSKLEQQGLIQGFEFTHELAWNVMKDFLENKGFVGLIGSKDATRTAFKNELISDGEVWMDMIKARNLSSHTYNTEIAEAVVDDILHRFYQAFVAMQLAFSELAGKDYLES